MGRMLAETNVAGIALLALGGLLLLASIVVLTLRSRARGRAPEVPYGMRPGPSDAALETPLLNRYQGWGVLVVAFLVVWFPVVWLLEPDTSFRQEEDLRTIAADRGARAVMPFSEENQFGVGCTQCHGPELKGGVIQAGGTYAYPRPMPWLRNSAASQNLLTPRNSTPANASSRATGTIPWP